MNKLLNPNSRVIAFLETCFDLALLNCLFLTFSLPLLSIGASLTALYRSIIDVMDSQRGQVTQRFYRYFKADAKQSTIFFCLSSLFILFLVMNISLLDKMTGILYLFWSMSLVVMGFYVALVTFCAYYFLARYDNSLMGMVRAVFQLFSYEKGKIIVMLLPYLLVYAFFVSSSVGLFTAFYFLTFGGVSFLVVWKVLFFKKLLKPYERQSEKRKGGTLAKE